jgi:hypothetical protein
MLNLLRAVGSCFVACVAAFSLAAPAGAEGRGASQPSATLYVLESGGQRLAAFSSAAGLDPSSAGRRPGRILLRQGKATGAFFRWLEQGRRGRVAFDLSVTQRDASGAVIHRWVVRQASPGKYEGPTLSATGTDVAIDAIEISHEGIDLEK